ncbi:MAG: PQQ-binding-like beta-propeller repeat protein [Dehalococcoidia bacterium]|nr:PQQ-binding-like beta-propeller repeat protein [Dehalococcoidia bacterium]
MAQTSAIERTTGSWRRWFRNYRFWLAVALLIVILLVVWAYRAFQVGPLLFPPADVTANHNMSEAAGDWPSIRRSANGAGWSPGPAPMAPFTTLWEIETPGVMMASSAIVGDAVFITTEDGIAAALSTESGEILWSYDVEAPSDSAPAVAGDTVYLGSRNHRILALGQQDGQLRWERNLGNIVLGSAIVVDGTVYIGSTNGDLEALDAATGETRWSVPTSGWVVGHPATDGSVVAVTSLGERFITIDAETGRRRLVFFSGTPVVGGPIIADGRAYFVTNRGGVWAMDTAAVSRPFSRFAYVAKFNFFYWRLLKTPPQQTGTAWVASAQGRVKYSPTYADGRLFVVNEDNKVTAFDDAGGDELWETQLAEEVITEPMAAGDVLILGTVDGALIALNTSDGTEAWRHTLAGSWLSATPVVSGETLYVPTADGRLLALRGQTR